MSADLSPDAVVEKLQPLLTPERLQKIERVVQNRTYNLSVVLENLFDDGNTSAVTRTCDALGLQRVNVVTGCKYFKSDRNISMGSHKWLDVYQYESSRECVQALKDEGYQIVVTHLEGSIPLSDVDFTKKTAIVLGNERDGVTDEMVELADVKIRVPMVGMVQSFNISVCAAICLYHGIQARHEAFGAGGDLTEEEKQSLRARLFRRSVKRSELILDRA